MRDKLLNEQAEQLARLLPKLMRAISTLDTEDATIDLSLAQLRACNILNECPRTASKLAQALGITVSAVTQIADRLEAAGIIERLSGLQDRRTKDLRLTEQGMQLLRLRRARRVRRAKNVLDKLSPAMREEALKALRVLLEVAPAAAGASGDHAPAFSPEQV
jgi:DNA-binding MarR family transcriptional regulator